MKTLPTEIEAMTETGLFTLARCVRITTRDGFRFGLIDHDVDKEVFIDEGSGDLTVYQASPGMNMSDIELSIGLESDSTEITIPIGDLITRVDVLGRRFNSAEVLIFDIDWTQQNLTSANIAEILSGHVSEARLAENKAVFEIRSQADLWNQVIGRILSPRCSADFGDVQCGVTPTPIAATVTAAGYSDIFSVSLGAAYADEYFRFGEAEFTSGALAGLPASEVYSFDSSSNIVTLFAPLPILPTAGDTLTLTRGCSRLKSSSDASIPTCATYDNVNRFRGFDRVPGSDTYLRVAVPGASTA